MATIKKPRARRKASTTRTRSTFQVVVGNIGTVYTGKSEVQANRDYRHYVGESLTGRGRAAGESVMLYENDDLIAQHWGEVDLD